MSRVYIIAEIGVNHNGDIDIAKELIDLAKECGANAVKFQSFTADNLVTMDCTKANYQLQNTIENESAYDMLKKLELNKFQTTELMNYCKYKKIDFLSSPFDIQSIDMLDELGVDRFKIPSGEITNLPYLRKINATKKDVILSTGMSTLFEIKEALNILVNNKITLLHCNTQYPTDMKDVNLLAMIMLKNYFNLDVGYSDHTQGIEVAIGAVALGALVIEKHFTLDKNMKGPDHKASINPYELKSMVDAIRNIEIALGSYNKIPTKSELTNLNVARKSIVAKVPIKKGELFTEYNLTTKRPSVGISPMRWDEVIGSYSDRDYSKDEVIVI